MLPWQPQKEDAHIHHAVNLWVSLCELCNLLQAAGKRGAHHNVATVLLWCSKHSTNVTLALLAVAGANNAIKTARRNITRD